MAVLFSQLCDVYKVTSGTQGRLGSESRQLTKVLEAVPCTYLSETEKAVNTTSAELVQVETSLLMLPPRAAIEEQMVVKNIRLKNNQVVQPGPFLIERFTDHTPIGKVLHHRTAMLKLDLSLEME